MSDRGDLKKGEPHPAASSALEYLSSLGIEKLNVYMGAFSNVAIESNRLGEICSKTLHRILLNEPVSDRYLLGLAWTIKSMEERE